MHLNHGPPLRLGEVMGPGGQRREGPGREGLQGRRVELVPHTDLEGSLEYRDVLEGRMIVGGEPVAIGEAESMVNGPGSAGLPSSTASSAPGGSAAAAGP